MRRKILIITAVALAAVIAVIAVGCTSRGVEKIGEPLADYAALEVTGLNAYEVADKIITLQDTPDYYLVKYYAYESEMYTRYDKTIIKANGNNRYASLVQTSDSWFKPYHNAFRYYYNGDQSYSIKITDDRGKVPCAGDGEEIFTVSDWGEYQPFDISAEERNSLHNDMLRLHSYEITGSNGGGDVYVKADKYYFTFTFDLSDVAQSAAVDEINKRLGEKGDITKPTAKTTVEYEIEPYNNGYRLLRMRIVETFDCTIGGAMVEDLILESYIEISYDQGNYAINSNDLLNMA